MNYKGIENEGEGVNGCLLYGEEKEGMEKKREEGCAHLLSFPLFTDHLGLKSLSLLPTLIFLCIYKDLYCYGQETIKHSFFKVFKFMVKCVSLCEISILREGERERDRERERESKRERKRE